MKLIRFGNPGEEKPGLQLEDGRRIDSKEYDMHHFKGIFMLRKSRKT